MVDRSPQYVPDGYAPLDLRGATVWLDPAEQNDLAEKGVPALVPQALAAVSELLSFRPTRAVHAVIYASAEDSRMALGRHVPSTFLMAPLHAPTEAVIALHSPRLDGRNGDPSRMLRHLCHEVSHVFAAERTGSTKRLGDANTGMRLRPWVDEGLGVCVAAAAAGQPDAMARALQGDVANASMDDVDRELCSLDSALRSWAFAAATSRVWFGVQRRGFGFVFDHLDQPARWA